MDTNCDMKHTDITDTAERTQPKVRWSYKMTTTELGS